MSIRQRLLPIVLAVAAAAAVTACSEDPEAASRRYTASGDSYQQQRQFKEAIIEYRNALKAAPNDAAVRYKLGRSYQDAGDPVAAYAEFARAADLDPSNVDAQMRAGTLLLVAREFEAARTRAELALKADPNHPPAHILLGNAMAGLNETASALRQIEQAINLDPAYAPAWTALGAVNFVGGRRGEAAKAFARAVDLAPKSIDARLALANFQWAKGETAEAEKTLLVALQLDQANESAHRALALLYVTTRRAAAAEPHFKALAGSTAGKLALADYYMGVGRNTDALTVLHEVEGSPEKSDARAARLRTAAIHYGSGKKAEAHKILDALIHERPRNAEARTAKARMLLTDGAPPADALAHAREAVKAAPDSSSSHYALGLAAVAARQNDEAERAFEEAARISPRAAAAQSQLARIRLARGDAAAAVSAAEAAVHHRPADVEAAVLLSQTLRAQGNTDRATRELTRRLAANADSAPLHLEMGWVQLQRRNFADARASFERSLRLAPQASDARAGLVAVDLAERKNEDARALVAGWRKSLPADHRLAILAAKVEIADGRLPAAERLLMDVLAADTSQLEAYELLGRTYAAQGKVDEAVRQYEAMATRAPASAASAKTMIGMLHEARNDRAAARTAYEGALAADPGAGVAANNLAWIYAEEGKLDEALRLATTAQQALRRRPEAEDTIGWIYLKKELPVDAIAAFERARDRAPSNALYHYHLGLAYMKTGDKDRARSAFARALELQPDFASADEARQHVAALAEPAAAAK